MSGSPSEVVANLITGASSNCQESREHIWWWGIKMDHSSGLDDVSLERYSGQTRSDKQSHDKGRIQIGNGWKLAGESERGKFDQGPLICLLGILSQFLMSLQTWFDNSAQVLIGQFECSGSPDCWQFLVRRSRWSRTHATKLFLLRIRAEAASQGDQSVASVRWPLPLPRDNPIKLQLSKFICQENTLHLTSNHYRYQDKDSIWCQLDDVQSNIQWPPRVNKWPTLPLTTENGKNLTIKLEREVLVGS